MAKLNGVSVIDMTGGEVTKINYEGAEYEKVEGKPKVGDIAEAIQRVNGIGVGEFAKVDDLDRDGDPIIEPRGPYFGARFNFYRKAKSKLFADEYTESPSLASRVSTLESDVAELKGEAEPAHYALDARQDPPKTYRKVVYHNPKAGGYVKWSEIDPVDKGDVVPEKFYEVKGVDFDGDLKVANDKGYTTYADSHNHSEEFEVYERVGEQQAEAEPKVDDRVRGTNGYASEMTGVVNAIRPSGFLDSDEGLTFISDNSGRKVWAYIKDVEIIEKAPKDPRKAFENGEKVRLVSGGSSYPLNGFKDGEIYEVNEVEAVHEGTDHDKIRIASGSFKKGYAKPEQLEKVAEKETLKVGDYAKVADHVDHDGYAGAGDVVELIDSGSCYDFKVRKLVNGGIRHGHTYFNRSKLTPATDEEVSAVKAEAKWTKIGRKPNEFKEGDLVRFGESTGSPEYPKGSYATVERVYGRGGFTFGGGYGGSPSWVSEIIPKESRISLAD